MKRWPPHPLGCSSNNPRPMSFFACASTKRLPSPALLLLLLLWMFAALLSIVVVIVHGETLAQRQALYEFYIATNHSDSGGWTEYCSDGGWRTLGGSPPVTFCNSATGVYTTFVGVTCDALNGNVTELDWRNCNLVGTLTPLLSSLSELQKLVLSANRLYGTLPSAWSRMSNLKTLSLNVNQLSGTLPPEWSMLVQVEQLHLYSNQLTGTLPTQWSALRNVQRLSLYLNDLSGTLPPEWPEGMHSISPFFASCNVSCSGVIGVNASCLIRPPNSCRSLQLWYNCMNLAVLPPVNSSNRWNWDNRTSMYFGPQRTDCNNNKIGKRTASSSISISSTVSLSMTPMSPSSWTADRTATTKSVSLSACGPRPLRGTWALWNGSSKMDAVVEEASVSGASGSADVVALRGRRCLALVVWLPEEGEAAGWTITDGVGSPAVSLLGDVVLRNELDNVTVVRSGSGERNATVWLCTTRVGGLTVDPPPPPSLSAASQSQMLLRVSVGCQCAAGKQHLPPVAGPALSLKLTFPSPLRNEDSSTAMSLAMEAVTHTPLRRVAQLTPIMQRAGGGACASDGPDSGIWQLEEVYDGRDVDEEVARSVGAVVGNVLFVAVAWGALSVIGVCVARWWHRSGTSLPEAARNAHAASLWAPFMSMVLVPVTANSVSLLKNREPIGVAGLAVVLGDIAALTWVSVAARTRLRVESVRPDVGVGEKEGGSSRVVQQLALLTRRVVQEHWVAKQASHAAVAFKRHAQLILSQATAWWYCPLEAGLGIMVGIADGAGSCMASVAVGVTAQFALAAIVAWQRPHGELLGHWATLIASLASGTSVLLAALAPTTVIAVQCSVSLTLIASAVSLPSLAVMVLSAILWTFLPDAVWRSLRRRRCPTPPEASLRKPKKNAAPPTGSRLPNSDVPPRVGRPKSNSDNDDDDRRKAPGAPPQTESNVSCVSDSVVSDAPQKLPQKGHPPSAPQQDEQQEGQVVDRDTPLSNRSGGKGRRKRSLSDPLQSDTNHNDDDNDTTNVRLLQGTALAEDNSDDELIGPSLLLRQSVGSPHVPPGVGRSMTNLSKSKK